jgi:hypothetical protein
VGGAGQSGKEPSSGPAAEPPPPPQPDEPATGKAFVEPPVGASGRVHGRRRPASSSLVLRFEQRPGDNEPGRLVDNAIWVNEAHPAYRRAVESRALGYHIAVTVALSLAPLAVDPADEHGFLAQFLAHWGAPGTRQPRRRSTRRRAS